MAKKSKSQPKKIENKQRTERKAAYTRNLLPRLKLDDKKALDLQQLRGRVETLRGPRRSMLMARIYFEQKRRKAEKRRARREAESQGLPVERQEPLTIERMRQPDETIVEKNDIETRELIETDEFLDHFNGEKDPKVLMTTGKKPTKHLIDFLKDIKVTIPNCHYYKRLNFEMKKIIEDAKAQGYTVVLVFIERHRKPYGVYMSHLPEGPTTFYRITGVKLAKDILDGACLTDHRPEIIMRNFDTQLGIRIARQLQAVFPINAEFTGRRVVVFHNQRDFIFFRQYRYIFSDKGEAANLQEIGPRFTLKLRFCHEGTFNTTEGKFEYCWRPDMQVSRKVFYI